MKLQASGVVALRLGGGTEVKSSELDTKRRKLSNVFDVWCAKRKRGRHHDIGRSAVNEGKE